MNPIITTRHANGRITEKVRSADCHAWLGEPPETGWVVIAHKMREMGWEGPRQLYFPGPATRPRLGKGFERVIRDASPC